MFCSVLFFLFFFVVVVVQNFHAVDVLNENSDHKFQTCFLPCISIE